MTCPPPMNRRPSTAGTKANQTSNPSPTLARNRPPQPPQPRPRRKPRGSSKANKATARSNRPSSMATPRPSPLATTRPPRPSRKWLPVNRYARLRKTRHPSSSRRRPSRCTPRASRVSSCTRPLAASPTCPSAGRKHIINQGHITSVLSSLKFLPTSLVLSCEN